MNSNLDKPSVWNNNFFNDHPVSIHFLLLGRLIVLVEIAVPFLYY